MAEAIAELVLNKLADAAIKEVVFLYGAGDKLNSLDRELRFIKAFLKDAESKCNSDERVKTWVNEVRDAAYQIEDVVETFVADVEGGNRSGKMKECADKYDLNRGLGESSSSALPRRPIRKIILPDVDDLDVIGFQKDQNNIMNLLFKLNNQRRCVVSIVGPGGIGKTTLAKKVYNSDEVKKVFEYRMWLSVSQQYRLQDLLKTMLERIRHLTEDEKALLQSNNQNSRQTEEHFLTELRVFLEQKRYLIILDDVWTEDLWIQIENALLDVKNGSRVLVTTRFSDIARKADANCDPYNLDYLSEKESQQLLLKKAFPNQDFKTFPRDLSDLLKKFAEKCGGLPLALVVVGSLLSRQPPMYNSWHKVFEKLSWYDGEGKKCIEILATSYEDLPLLLKPCFMYFGLFPDDHEVKAKSLLRMWVAEGFIPAKDRRTMEQTAEEYLEELVDRSMIQVSQRYHNGSIKYCRIHDLMRDLAILKGRENGFLETIASQEGSCNSSTVIMRRAAVHYYRKDIMKTAGRNLRSLLFFSTDFPNLKRFKLLKVFNAAYPTEGYYRDEHIKGNTLKKTVQLRYMSISTIDLWFLPRRGFLPWSKPPETQFWRSIIRMRNLQTLLIPTTINYSDSNLFDRIWDIKTLRHVNLPPWYYGPPSTAHLPNLQTLKVVRVRAEWLSKGWPTMPNIRVLKLGFLQSNYKESFCTFLRELHHLTSLHVSGNLNWEYEISDTNISAFPWYNRLQSLLAGGKWTNTAAHNDHVPCALNASSLPVNLTKLNLKHSRIHEDPMPVLENLKYLRVLQLEDFAYEGRLFNCSTSGFPYLQILSLFRLMKLEVWNADIAAGSMPMLKEIKIGWCPSLRLIPGLHHMTSLTKFFLSLGSEDLYRSLREDESHKIRDGQFVDFDIH